MELGERQIAPTLAGIREDHVARYRWVAPRLAGKRVIDAGCGIGYGSLILAEAGCNVLAVDNCEEALDYAMEHYQHDNITYINEDLTRFTRQPIYDAVVCFEVLEHLKAPGMVLANLATMVPDIFVSVPNEDVFPWNHVKFHERHYTAGQFEGLLNDGGWEVQEWFGQKNKRGGVMPRICGRTLIAVAKHWTGRDNRGQFVSGGMKTDTHKQLPPPPAPPPKRVAIVAMGKSKSSYFENAATGGGRHTEWDEVWAINSTGGIIQHDRLVHMDDVLVQEARTALNPEVKGILGWLEKHPGPVYTSTTSGDVLEKAVEIRTALGSGQNLKTEGMTHEEVVERSQETIDHLEDMAPRYDRYPGLVSFPLREVIESTGAPYLNNTCAMAIAYAIHIGVKCISLFGVDFTYPDAHISEKGRGCCEFLLGLAASRGIEIKVPIGSTLMDANVDQKFYGYDAWHLAVEQTRGGGVNIIKTPKDLPTAEEMEERYRKIPKELERQ